MITATFTQQEWELLIAIVEDSEKGYLAKPIIGEIKNQIIRQCL